MKKITALYDLLMEVLTELLKVLKHYNKNLPKEESYDDKMFCKICGYIFPRGEMHEHLLEHQKDEAGRHES